WGGGSKQVWEGIGRGKGDWLRSEAEVPVPFPGAPGYGVRSAGNGDRHLEDSEPVPVSGSAIPSRPCFQSRVIVSCRFRRTRATEVQAASSGVSRSEGVGLWPTASNLRAAATSLQ